MQKTINDFSTPCGRQFGWQKDIANVNCPNCGYFFREYDFTHDGYPGSLSAHDGAGSSGLADHHYFAVCPTCRDCDCDVCREKEMEDSKSPEEKILEELNVCGGFICYMAGDNGENIFFPVDDPSYSHVLLPVPNGWVWCSLEEQDISFLDDAAWNRPLSPEDIRNAKEVSFEEWLNLRK